MAKKEILVVASKVKNFVKGKKCHTSKDAVGALSDMVEKILENAVKRCNANR